MGLGKLKMIAVAATFAMVGTTLAAAPAYAAPVKAADPAGVLTSDISGTFTDANGGVGTVTGTFVPTEFQAAADNSIVAVGTLTGTLTDAAGTVIGTDTTTATVPLQSAVVDPTSKSAKVQAAAIGCNVLDLVLGPLDLNLLGLVVHLDRVHLNLTALPGGGLLGDLLCSLSGLLSGGLGGLVGQIVALLNQILGSLGGL